MAIAAVAGIASGLGAAAAGLTFFGLTGLAAFGGYFALGAGLSMLSRALAPKPNIGAQLQGITTTTREPATPRKIIYGKIRVGGQVVFIHHSGTDNRYLHMAISFATHEVESFDEIWFNDKKIWTTVGFVGDWGTYVSIDRKFGTADQTASTQLVASSNKWTTDHKLSGIAYIAFRLDWNQNKFPQGVPNITAVIRGKKVYDPRDSNQSATDASTWTYSQNPALCVRDYMVDKKYGLGEAHTMINSSTLEAAADLCDESVDIDGGGTQTRFLCNGVIDTNNQIRGNIEQILSSMGGRLTYSGGEYFIDGAEYRTPTLTFTEADIVSDIQTQTKQSRRGIYNGVKGIFVSEEKNYKVLDYPAQISSTYEAEDGDPIYLDMPLPCVTNNLQAQRLAKISLLKSRQQVVMTMTTNLKGLRVKVGDTIRVTNNRLNYSNKVFEVIDYSLGITDGAISVNLSCIETASALYDWSTNDEQAFLSGGELDLYDGRTVDNVTNLTASEIVTIGPDGNATTSVELSWTAPDDAFIDFYKVRWNKVGTTDYFHAETKETRILITGLDVTSNYDFRVQVQNLIGVTSTGVSLDDEVLEGDTTAPAVPTIVGTEGGIQTITLTWQNPSDTDFKHVEVFVNTTNSIPSNPTSVVDGETYTIGGLVGAQTRFFWLKSVDFSGNKSAATTGVSGTSVKVDASDIEDGAIDLAAFASGIAPVQIVATLPASASQGDLAFLTTNNKLYRYDGSAWTLSVDGADVTAGTLPANAIVANSITSGQIQAGAISANEISVTNLAAISSVLGTLTAGTIDADVVDITNLSVGTADIEDLAVTGAKIGSLAVDTLKIADNAVTIPESAVGTTHSSIGSSSSPTVLLTKTITYDSGAAPEAIMVSGFVVVKSDQSQVGYIKAVLEVAGSDVFTSANTNTTTTTETKAFVHRVTGLTGTSVTLKLKVYRTGSSSNANVYQSGILILGAKK